MINLRIMSLFPAMGPQVCRVQLWRIVLALFLVSLTFAAPRSRRQAQPNQLSLLPNQEIEPTAAPDVEAPEMAEGAIAPQQAPGQATGGKQPQASALNTNNNNNAIQQAPANSSPNKQASPPKTINVVVRGPGVSNSLPEASANNYALPQAPGNYVPVSQPIDPRFTAWQQAPSQGQVNNNAAPLQVSPQRNVGPQARLDSNTIGSQASASSSGNAGTGQQMITDNSPRLAGTIAQAPETEPVEAAPASTGVLPGNNPPAQPGPMQPVLPNLSVNNAPQVAPWVYTPMIPGVSSGVQNANTGRGFQSLMPGGEVEAAEAVETQAGAFTMSGLHMASLSNAIQGQVGFGAEMETAMLQAPLMGSVRGLQRQMGGQAAMPMHQAAMQAFPRGGQPPIRALTPGLEVEPPQVQEVEPAEGAGAMMGNMMAPYGQPAPGASPQASGQQWPSAWTSGNSFAWTQAAF